MTGSAVENKFVDGALAVLLFISVAIVVACYQKHSVLAEVGRQCQQQQSILIDNTKYDCSISK